MYDVIGWCGQWRMSHTDVFLRCMHPKLENARKDIWDRPGENCLKGQHPQSGGQLLGKSKWEKPLADWIIMATGVGFLGPENRGLEAERVERKDRWRRKPFV
jgi:hypothetical protein